jgi:hypothetical protein
MSIYPPTGTLEIKNATLKIPVVDLQYTSNTAKLEANSNVVTEFSRSKKLIKYPRVALTQNAENNGYAAEASTENDGTSTGQAYRVFDGVRLERGHHGTNGTYSSGTYQSNKSITDANNKIHTGEWIKLQMPATEKMQLRGFTFHPRNETYGPYRIPLEGVFLGSMDGNNWYPIHYFYNFAVTNGSIISSTKYFEPTNHVYYNHIAFVAYKLQNHSHGSVLNFAELDLYGTPEYDPEAHGTDVTVKSYPNVPNTDWLEVYYDAKDLTSILGTVADLSGKSVTGTLNGDVSIDTLNDVKSFSFDGSGDYISGTLTNTGDFDFTVSTWVYETNGTTNNTIWMIGSGSGNSNPNPSVALAVDSAGSLDFFVFSGTEIRMSNFRDTFGINKWHHIVCTRTGTALKYFINGIDQNRPASANLDPLSIAANSIFNIGARTGNQLGINPMHGKIANFRLFNRALSSDEIYQLYAYQKEDFGHGDLSMTLKAGRLGIGTSEPRVALDVRGEIRAVGSMLYLLDTPLTHEWHWSGSTSATAGSEQRIHYNQFPPNCRAIYADVFLPMASAGDHGTHVLGESWLAIGRTWTDGRSSTTATTNNARPSTYMTTGVTQGAKVVYIGQPGQSDNFEYHYGNWWSLIIPLGDGNNLYHGRTGYGGTHGWIYVYTKGYYV